MTEEATPDDPYNVVSEHYHVFPGLPVAVCVLETASGFFSAGVSGTSRFQFDEELCQRLARRNARRHLENHYRPPADRKEKKS